METTAPFAALFDLYRALVHGESRSAEERQEAKALRDVAKFSLLGPLSAGKSTSYSINGVDFEIDPTTAIVGELQFGALARVSGIYRQHTIRCAKKILVEPKRKK